MLRCAITPGLLRSKSPLAMRDALVDRCRKLAADGVDVLIVREKLLEAGELAELTAGLIAAASGLTILVARRPDIALATGAQGVHLSAAAGELTVAQVRTLMPKAFVTVSCHSVPEVQAAAAAQASAILFAPVFGKQIDGREITPAAGLQRLRAACAAAGQIPVWALGGVTAVEVSSCGAAGAVGVAGIRMFFPAGP